MNELKPCPWCGGEATWSDFAPVKWAGINGVPYQLGCGNSACPVHPYAKVCSTKRAAISGWNTRTPHADKEEK